VRLAAIPAIFDAGEAEQALADPHWVAHIDALCARSLLRREGDGRWRPAPGVRAMCEGRMPDAFAEATLEFCERFAASARNRAERLDGPDGMVVRRWVARHEMALRSTARLATAHRMLPAATAIIGLLSRSGLHPSASLDLVDTALSGGRADPRDRLELMFDRALLLGELGRAADAVESFARVGVEARVQGQARIGFEATVGQCIHLARVGRFSAARAVLGELHRRLPSASSGADRSRLEEARAAVADGRVDTQQAVIGHLEAAMEHARRTGCAGAEDRIRSRLAAARVKRGIGDVQDAMEALAAIRRLGGTPTASAGAHDAIGLCLLDLGQLSSAARHFAEAHAAAGVRAGGHGSVAYLLRLCLVSLERFDVEGARRHCIAATETLRGDRTAHPSSLDRILDALTAGLVGEPDPALAVLDGLHDALDPEDWSRGSSTLEARW